jgi:hypothetical protein
MLRYSRLTFRSWHRWHEIFFLVPSAIPPGSVTLSRAPIMILREGAGQSFAGHLRLCNHGVSTPDRILVIPIFTFEKPNNARI